MSLPRLQYWLAHYNWDKATKSDHEIKMAFGLTRADLMVLSKRIGAIFAFFGFGTFYAAIHALRAKVSSCPPPPFIWLLTACHDGPLPGFTPPTFCHTARSFR